MTAPVSPPLLADDAVLFGVLATILGLVFLTSDSKHPFWRGLYTIFPPLLICYFAPSLLTTFGLADPDASQLYFVASRFLLPAALVVLTMSSDLPATFSLGPKALIMFFAGTLGVVIGGPLAILLTTLIAPDIAAGDGPDAMWRGMATVAGSWIGGSANQTAMYEIFEVGGDVFSIWIAVDVILANIWMAGLLLLAANRHTVDRWLKADVGAIDRLRQRTEVFEQEHARTPQLKHYVFVLAIAFGATGVAHFMGDLLSAYFGREFPNLRQLSLDSQFFWLIALATLSGVLLSFTGARKLQGVGAMKIGSLFIYIMVATVGLRMDVRALFDAPAFFLVGAIWLAVHAGILIIAASITRAPSFFIATGSMANIGGAASAPIVASAFHPSLASVGVLLAVLGYIIGTFGAWLTGLVMQQIALGVTP